MKITFKNKRVHDYKEATWMRREGNAIHLMKTVMNRRTGKPEAVGVAVVDGADVENVEGEATPEQAAPPSPVPTVESEPEQK